MTQADIHDDGFRVTELGAFRWRVDPMHEAVAVRAIRRRWKHESGMVGGITFLRDEQLRNEIMGDAACAAALRPFGLSQSSLSQAEPAPAIARRNV